MYPAIFVTRVTLPALHLQRNRFAILTTDADSKDPRSI
jgi:hypothetical protein